MAIRSGFPSACASMTDRVAQQSKVTATEAAVVSGDTLLRGHGVLVYRGARSSGGANHRVDGHVLW